MRTFLKGLAAAVVLALAGSAILSASANAGPSPDIYQSGKKEFGADYAVGGYDAVAYQTKGLPVAGDKSISYAWKGANWLFASAENLEKFKAAPDTYAPQYGGYCAYGVSQGSAVHGDPKYWTVRSGKLYLNYDEGVQKTWIKDPDGYIKTADTQWPKVLGK
jgi:YHS domain-containing protein